MHLIYFSCYTVFLNGMTLKKCLGMAIVFLTLSKIISKDDTKDTVWLDNYFEKYLVDVTTVQGRTNTIRRDEEFEYQFSKRRMSIQ